MLSPALEEVDLNVLRVEDLQEEPLPPPYFDYLKKHPEENNWIQPYSGGWVHSPGSPALVSTESLKTQKARRKALEGRWEGLRNKNLENGYTDDVTDYSGVNQGTLFISISLLYLSIYHTFFGLFSPLSDIIVNQFLVLLWMMDPFTSTCPSMMLMLMVKWPLILLEGLWNLVLVKLPQILLFYTSVTWDYYWFYSGFGELSLTDNFDLPILSPKNELLYPPHVKQELGRLVNNTSGALDTYLKPSAYLYGNLENYQELLREHRDWLIDPSLETGVMRVHGYPGIPGFMSETGFWTTWCPRSFVLEAAGILLLNTTQYVAKYGGIVEFWDPRRLLVSTTRFWLAVAKIAITTLSEPSIRVYDTLRRVVSPTDQRTTVTLVTTMFPTVNPLLCGRESSCLHYQPDISYLSVMFPNTFSSIQWTHGVEWLNKNLYHHLSPEEGFDYLEEFYLNNNCFPYTESATPPSFADYYRDSLPPEERHKVKSKNPANVDPDVIKGKCPIMEDWFLYEGPVEDYSLTTLFSKPFQLITSTKETLRRWLGISQVIEKYNRYGNQWWKPNGEFGASKILASSKEKQPKQDPLLTCTLEFGKSCIWDHYLVPRFPEELSEDPTKRTTLVPFLKMGKRVVEGVVGYVKAPLNSQEEQTYYLGLAQTLYLHIMFTIPVEYLLKGLVLRRIVYPILYVSWFIFHNLMRLTCSSFSIIGRAYFGWFTEVDLFRISTMVGVSGSGIMSLNRLNDKPYLTPMEDRRHALTLRDTYSEWRPTSNLLFALFVLSLIIRWHNIGKKRKQQRPEQGDSEYVCVLRAVLNCLVFTLICLLISFGYIGWCGEVFIVRGGNVVPNSRWWEYLNETKIKASYNGEVGDDIQTFPLSASYYPNSTLSDINGRKADDRGEEGRLLRALTRYERWNFFKFRTELKWWNMESNSTTPVETYEGYLRPKKPWWSNFSTQDVLHAKALFVKEVTRYYQANKEEIERRRLEKQSMVITEKSVVEDRLIEPKEDDEDLDVASPFGESRIRRKSQTLNSNNSITIDLSNCNTNVVDNKDRKTVEELYNFNRIRVESPGVMFWESLTYGPGHAGYIHLPPTLAARVATRQDPTGQYTKVKQYPTKYSIFHPDPLDPARNFLSYNTSDPYNSHISLPTVNPLFSTHQLTWVIPYILFSWWLLMILPPFLMALHLRWPFHCRGYQIHTSFGKTIMTLIRASYLIVIEGANKADDIYSRLYGWPEFLDTVWEFSDLPKEEVLRRRKVEQIDGRSILTNLVAFVMCISEDEIVRIELDEKRKLAEEIRQENLRCQFLKQEHKLATSKKSKGSRKRS